MGIPIAPPDHLFPRSGDEQVRRPSLQRRSLAHQAFVPPTLLLLPVTMIRLKLLSPTPTTVSYCPLDTYPSAALTRSTSS